MGSRVGPGQGTGPGAEVAPGLKLGTVRALREKTVNVLEDLNLGRSVKNCQNTGFS